MPRSIRECLETVVPLSVGAAERGLKLTSQVDVVYRVLVGDSTDCSRF